MVDTATIASAILVPGLNPHLSHLFCTVKMVFVWIHWSNSYKSPNSFITGHLCFFWHCVTVLSLSHVTVCQPKYLFKLPLLEAEHSSHMLLVPQLVPCCSLIINWCHVVSDSALILFHLSSNSPQTDCCYNSHHIIWAELLPLIFIPYELAQLCILPSHMYEFVQNTNDIRLGGIQFVFNHELQSYIKRHLPSCGTNEYMVLYHYNPWGWWISWYQFCCHGQIVNDTYWRL